MRSTSDMPSPFHPGETAIQERLGVRDKIDPIGRRIIRDYIPDEHRAFFTLLPFLVVGAVDAEERPWATLLTGAPGFVSSPDPRTLLVHARPPAGDPLAAALTRGAAVGLLGIELPTRRRNRANGRITEADRDGLRVEVVESFGNCPKYIQTRAFDDAASTPRPVDAMHGDGTLTPWARGLVETADTVFVASFFDWGARRAVDVSHRGGRPGFIGTTSDGKLTFPDYTGNFLFNTLGNLLANPRAGVVVPDFRTGDVLYLTGDTEIVWDGPEVAAVAGADRLWRLRPRAAVGLAGVLPLRGDVIRYSPFLPDAGA